MVLWLRFGSEAAIDHLPGWSRHLLRVKFQLDQRRSFIGGVAFETATTASIATVRTRSPGSLLLHPYFLGSLSLLVMDDHLFKSWWPGLVTEKLSYLAGAFLLPVLVVSLGEVVASRPRRPRFASVCVSATVCAVVAVGLIIVKVWPAASGAYGTVVGYVRYPFVGSFRQVEVATNPTDLVALVSVVLAFVYCIKRTEYRREAVASPQVESLS